MRITENILPALGIAVTSIAVVSVGVIIGLNSTKPPLMTWEAVSVENAPTVGEYLIVSGRQHRNDTSGCSNNFQADMRHDGDTEVRLPVPTRALKDDGEVRYDMVLPPDIEPGVYEIRVRESFNCGGGPVPIETPWMVFTVRDK